MPGITVVGMFVSGMFVGDVMSEMWIELTPDPRVFTGSQFAYHLHNTLTKLKVLQRKKQQRKEKILVGAGVSGPVHARCAGLCGCMQSHGHKEKKWHQRADMQHMRRYARHV